MIMDDFAGYRRLGQAVLLQASEDYYRYIKDRRARKRVIAGISYEGMGTYEWTETSDFAFWCDVADLDRDMMRQGFRKISNGKRISVLEKGGGIK